MHDFFLLALEVGAVIHYPELVHLQAYRVGAGTRKRTFAQIECDIPIGHNCRISSHSFLREGVTTDHEVLIGHGVMSSATNPDGRLQTIADWTMTRDVPDFPVVAGVTVKVVGRVEDAPRAGAYISRSLA